MKVLVTGSAGFLGTYVVQELISHGYEVIGLDNFSKYGFVKQKASGHTAYQFFEGDCKDAELVYTLLDGCEQMICLASLVGGVEYFHRFSYDIISENEKITANCFDQAIRRFKMGSLKKINVISSSMVYERSQQFPLREEQTNDIAIPLSSYGFQKMATEVFAHAAYDQYKLPYTIIRPFNCIGVGEYDIYKTDMYSKAEVNLISSHVIPDLIKKAHFLPEQFSILGNGNQVRNFTSGRDLARGIRLCLESESAYNQAFNLSSEESITILELAKRIWHLAQPHKPFQVQFSQPFKNDVVCRIPNVSKAAQLLNFKANEKLDDCLAEIYAWMLKNVLTLSKLRPGTQAENVHG